MSAGETTGNTTESSMSNAVLIVPVVLDKQSLNINSSTNPHDMPAMPISTPTPKTTLTGNVQTTSKSAGETNGNTTESSMSNAVLIVLVVIGCSVLAVIVMISVFLRRKCYSSSQKGKQNGDAPHPLEYIQCESQLMINAENDIANNKVELNLDMRS